MRPSTRVLLLTTAALMALAAEENLGQLGRAALHGYDSVRKAYASGDHRTLALTALGTALWVSVYVRDGWSQVSEVCRSAYDALPEAWQRRLQAFADSKPVRDGVLGARKVAIFCAANLTVAALLQLDPRHFGWLGYLVILELVYGMISLVGSMYPKDFDHARSIEFKAKYL